MGGLYNEFSILSVTPELSKKQLVIRTNFKVDPGTVNYDTVSFYDYDNGQISTYELKAEGKLIYIMLEDYPSNKSRYYLKVSKIKDALGRQLNHAYNNYVKFINDVETSVEVISPAFREAFTKELIEIRLKINKPMNDSYFRIEISSDNIFFNKVTSIICKVPNEYLMINNDTKFILTNGEDSEDEILITDKGMSLEISDSYIYNNELSLNTIVKHNGQLYIRARCELSEDIVGEWSDSGSFSIYTTNMESMETTFLEESIITHDLFDDNITYKELEITDKSLISNIKDGMFYIEFNNDISIPSDFKLTDDGYIHLDTVIGFRKELK